MKFFGRKKTHQEVSRPSEPGPLSAGESFYSRPGEHTLDETEERPSAPATRRTSRHSPARRREESNRASSRAIIFLLLRGVLIVVLLLGGFITLKKVLDRLSKPSEKEQSLWEANEALMEKTAGSGVSATDIAGSDESSDEQVQSRLNAWTLAEQHIRAAEAFSRRGIHESALSEVHQALRANPDSHAALQLLLELYLEQKSYAEAIPVCMRLLDQESEQWDLQVKLLQALQAGGRTDSAEMLATRMLAVQPNNMEVLQIAAEIRMTLQDIDGALVLFDRMLQNDSRNESALRGAASIHSSRAEWAEAVPYYLELIRTAPDADAYYALALCYAQMNEEGKAVIFLGQASSLYGSKTVSSWLRNPGFDSVRESVDFRAFTDHIVGIETRKAIEAIRQREADQTTPQLPQGLELPTPSQLKAIRPDQ